MKRLVGLLLSLTMIISLFSGVVYVNAEEEIVSVSTDSISSDITDILKNIECTESKTNVGDDESVLVEDIIEVNSNNFELNTSESSEPDNKMNDDMDTVIPEMDTESTGNGLKKDDEVTEVADVWQDKVITPDKSMYGDEPLEYLNDEGVPCVLSIDNSQAEYDESYLEQINEVIMCGDEHAIEPYAFTELSISNFKAQTIARGENFNIKVNPDGTVSAWGRNDYGQLGNGTYNDNYEPTKISNLSNIVSVVANMYTCLALSKNGDVYAWGRGTWGLCGDNSNTNKTTPIVVPGLENIVKVSAGRYNNMALKSNGDVYVWGSNGSGQLGIGSYDGASTPTKLENIPRMIDISAESFCSFAVDYAGDVWSWGSNNYCKLGLVDWGTYLSPTRTAISGIKHIAAGENHVIAIGDNGKVYTWGSNGQGALGVTNITSYTPQPQTPQLSNIVDVYTKNCCSIAYATNGEIYTWGKNDHGEVGRKLTDTVINTPGKLDYKFTSVDIGPHCMCGIDSNNIYLWGYMPYDSVDNYVDNKSTTPLCIPLPTVFKQIDARRDGVIAVDIYGDVYTWGDGTYGDLGHGNTSSVKYPKKVEGLSNIKMVAKGENHTLALDNNGNIWGWGHSVGGEAGAFADILTPRKIENFTNVKYIAAGEGFSAAIKNDGTVWTWGQKGNHLGYDVTANIAVPRKVEGISDASKIVCGEKFIAALCGQTIYTWGSNNYGQLCSNDTTARSTPKAVSGSYIDISSSRFHVLAISTDSKLYAWGRHGSGQLGIPLTAHPRTYATERWATEIGNPVTAIFAGYNSSYAVYNGVLYSWAEGRDGQLGYPVSGSQFLPKAVSKIPNPVTINGGGTFTIVTDSNNNMWTFGTSRYGQLAAVSNVPQKLCNADVAIFDAAVNISSGTAVDLSPFPGNQIFKFVPRSTSQYLFTTMGSIDTIGTLYDSDRNQLYSDDNSHINTNFKISTSSLASDRTYYLKVAKKSSGNSKLYIETPLSYSIK